MAASGPLEAAAQTAGGAAKAAATKGYKAPRNVYGQPDLSGYWTNVSMTPETRAAEYGNRLILREDEVAKLEADAEKEAAEGDAPTDPNAPAPKAGGEPSRSTRPQLARAGDGVGGYNRGWLDPGNHVMRVNGQPRSSILTTPDGKVPPRKPGAPPESDGRGGGANAFDSYEIRSLGERCIIGFGRNAGPPMMANGFYNNNYQIVQTPDHVVIEVEMVHDARIVRLNSKHRTDGVRPYMGDSIGWWEGDTLVVETTNIPKNQAYKGAWEKLKVTERFTRVSPTRINYKFTVEDPTVWDQAWGGEYEFNALEGRIFEYACHEGNYSLPGILAGARQEEKDAAAKKSGRAAGAGSSD
jgi:hypothetical protein